APAAPRRRARETAAVLPAAREGSVRPRRLSSEKPVRADLVQVLGDRRLVAPLSHACYEFLERREVGQGIAPVRRFDDVHEAYAIPKLERGITQARRLLALELLEHPLDEFLILGCPLGLDLVSDQPLHGFYSFAIASVTQQRSGREKGCAQAHVRVIAGKGSLRSDAPSTKRDQHAAAPNRSNGESHRFRRSTITRLRTT